MFPKDTTPWLFEPTPAAAYLIVAGLALSGSFFVLFAMSTLRARFDIWLLAQFDRPMVQQVSTWLGLFGLLIGTPLVCLS